MQPRPSGPLVRGCRELGELSRFTGHAIVALPRSFRYASEIIRQMAIIAPSTLLILAFMEAMIGVSSANFIYFLLKALGATDFAGIGGGLMPRVACAVMFGYAFVSKVGGGFTAELSAMKVNEEISALEATGVDPLRYVVGTRMIAVILLIPVFTGVSLVAFYGGFYFAVVTVLHGLSAASLNQFYWGTEAVRDLLYMFLVVASVTVTTAFAACFYGMRARGGPAEVGKAVAHCVLVNLLVLHVVGMLLVTIWYGSKFGLPIGG